MTSEIRTNSITSRAGMSTVTMTDSGPMFSGITTFVDNSGFTFGVGGGTSIFTPATNVLTFGTNNTEKIRIDASGHMHGVGVITATHFYGDGSNLTGLPAGTTINSNTNNYLITGTGTANTLQGEANLTFDGSTLSITGAATLGNGSGLNWGDTSARIRGESGSSGLLRFDTNGGERLRIDSAGRVLIGTTTEGAVSANNFTIASSSYCGMTIRSGTSSEGNIFFSDATSGNGESVGMLRYEHANDAMVIKTANAERLRIKSDGKVGVGTDSPLSILSAYGENRGEGTVTGQITAKDNAAYNASPTAGIVFQGHYASNNAQAIFAGITGFKENANDGNLAGALALHVRANGAVAYEALRIKSDGNVIIGSGGSWSYPKALNVQGSSGSILSLYNADTTTYAANTSTAIELKLLTGNTGNQSGSCEIRAFKENGTNGNNARALSFYTGANGGSPTEKLRINSSGHVTKPNQPSFHVSRRAGDVSANNYITFDQVFHNNGSHYNNSNGRFTAPVTGVYFFSAWNYTGGTSAFQLRINGSVYAEYTWDDTGGCGTWVCPMTAGQYAQIYTRYYGWRGTADYHNGFNGFLIG